jgi:hypothetical protein
LPTSRLSLVQPSLPVVKSNRWLQVPFSPDFQQSSCTLWLACPWPTAVHAVEGRYGC